MPLPSLIRPLSPTNQPARDWTVLVNGDRVDPVTSVVISADAYGTLSYGRTPAGHDGWSFREVGGGGPVILPFVVADGRLLVGVVRQFRPNQGGEVWDVPRGFIDQDERHDAAALRELREETGFQAMSLTPLPGEPANPNSTFFETPEPDDGVRFFAVRVHPSDVELHDGDVRFRPGILTSGDQHELGRLSERIGAVAFIPWTQAAQLGDIFSVAAVARLLCALHQTGAFEWRSS